MQTRYYVSCFVLRSAGGSHEFLQLKRSPEKYMGDSWQLVSGAIEPDETATAAMLREIAEETGLSPAEFYQLDVVNTFFIAKADAVLHGAMFCAIVSADAMVKLNAEHTDFRWMRIEQADSLLMWPGERAAAVEMLREIVHNGPAKPHLRLP